MLLANLRLPLKDSVRLSSALLVLVSSGCSVHGSEWMYVFPFSLQVLNVGLHACVHTITHLDINCYHER